MSDAQARQAIADTFDRAASTYDQVGVDFFTPIGRDLVARAGVRAGDRVLDLGAGRGAVTFAAAEAVGATGEVRAIDLAPSMVDLLQADAVERGLDQVTASVGDAEQPDFDPESFDAVLAGFFVYFLSEPLASLRRHASLLRPGGRLGFTTFAGNDPRFEAAMDAIGRFLPGGPPRRDQRQGPFETTESTAEVVTAAGLVIETNEVHDYESRYASPDHWIEATWSHGGRRTLELIPDVDLSTAIEAGKAEFESTRTAEDDYAVTTSIRFTVARLP